MKNWTLLLLRFDSFIFQLKTKLAEEKHIFLVFIWGFLILLTMLLQAIIALPLYIFIKPSSLKKQGASEKDIKVFTLKRQVTVSALAVFILVVCIKVFFAGTIIAFLFPTRKAAAANVSWAFGTPSDYVYDASKIQIVDGVALFKASNPMQPSPTEPPTQVTPTSTIIETIVTQVPTAAPTIEPVLAVTEIPAPTAAPVPVIETATPIPQPTTAPIQAPAPTNPPAAPVIQEPAPQAPAPAAPAPEQQSAPAPPPAEAPATPVLGAETSCVATIQPVNSLTVSSLDHWTSFNESAVTNGGSISYQLSDNGGQSWQYWNGIAWTTGDGWNSAGDINSHIILFPATGTLLFRAKMQSTCTQDMQLLSITANYDTKTTLLPTTIPTVSIAPTEVPVIQVHTVLPTLTSIPENIIETPSLAVNPSIVPTALPLPSATITPTPTTENILGNILNSIEEFFTGTSSAVPTPEIAVPTPTVVITTPIATGSSNLLQTDVTIQQPVPLVAPTTIEANVASIGATLTIPGSQGYNLPNIFSISGAFSLNALGTHTEIVAKAGSYSFGTSSDGKQLVLTLMNTEGVTQTISAPLPTLTGEQVNVAIATYDGTVVKLYVNGILIGTQDLQTTIAASENTVTIGEGDLLSAHVNPFVLYNSVLTPEEIALRYLQVNNFPAELVITGVEQIGGGDVKITYKLVDQNSHVLALDVYEYSTTGAFAGEQHVMTQDFDNSLHEGTHDLESSLTGKTHTFIWKAATDVQDLDHTKIYVKLRPFDGILAGQASIASLSVTTKPQTATITNVIQLPNGQVEGHYSLVGTDPHATVSLEVSQDNGETWQSATNITGDIGSVITSLDKTFLWDAEKDLSGHEIANMKLRLKVTDSLGNAGYSPASESFSFDTQAPFGLTNFHAVTATETTATLSWSPISSETHFKNYVIWYGTNQQDVENETGTAYVWNNTNDVGLSLQGTSAAVVPNLTANTTYFAKLVATDTFSHSSSLPVIQFTTGTVQTLISPILNQPQTSITEAIILPTNTPIVSVTPTPEPIINQIIGGIGNIIETILGIPTTSINSGSSTTPTVVPSIPVAIPSVTEVPLLSTVPAQIGTLLPTAIPTVSLPNPTLTVTPTPTIQTNNQTTSTSEMTNTTNNVVNQFFGNQSGPLPLTPVSSVQQSALASPTSLANQLNRSVESKIIPAPVVTKIDQPATRDAIHLSGRGIPNSEAVLYLFSQQAVIYRVPVKADGTWEFYHDQSYVDLQPGQHSVYAVTLNSGSNVKSKPSLVKSFVVKKDWRVILAKLIDIPTTIMTIIIIVIGIVWFNMRKKKR